MPSLADDPFLPTDRVSQLYMTIFAQEFSPCGKYLAISNSYGDIAVHHLDSVLKFRSRKSRPGKDEERNVVNKFQGHEDPVFSLTSNHKYLVSGSIGQIKGWRWAEIAEIASSEIASSSSSPSLPRSTPSWTLNVPVNKAVGSRPEINYMIIKGDVLYAAAGDGNVYGWSLDTTELIRKYEGHSDYVHCLAMKDDNLLLSGSEDGSLRFWDPRTSGSCVALMEPYKHSSCSRPAIGKWISCVDIEEDRVLCGGGPHLSLFHLKMSSSVYNHQSSKFSSASPLHVFKTEGNVTQNVVKFHEDGFLCAGSSPFVHHWDLSGRLSMSLAVTPSSVYTVASNDNSSKYPVMTIAGSSNKIDFCISKGYSSFSLTF